MNKQLMGRLATTIRLSIRQLLLGNGGEMEKAAGRPPSRLRSGYLFINDDFYLLRRKENDLFLPNSANPHATPWENETVRPF